MQGRASVHVRRATAGDAAAWLQMRNALWPEDTFPTHASEIERFFAGGLRDPLEVLLAVDDAGVPLGFAELSIRSYAEDCETDRVAYLEGWYVVPPARRHGVGRALVAAAEQWARAQGCTEFGSDAVLDNDVSAAAHRALGFEETAQLRCFRKPLASTASSSDRTAVLIRELRLRPHPEGGYYAEVFRSSARVTPHDGRGERTALTAIYYLLTAGQISRWHRVLSDEVWHFYEGAPLDLLVLDDQGMHLTSHRLGILGGGVQPTMTVAAGAWQAARPTGKYSLVGCTVAPGFDFADFTLARDVQTMAATIRTRHPTAVAFL